MHTRVHRTVALLIAAPIVFVLIMLGITHSGPAQQEAPLSSVLRLAAGHAISSASIDADGTVHVALRNGRLLVTHKEPGQVVTPALMAGGAQVSVNGEAPLGLGTILGGALTVLLVGVVLYSVRSSGAGAGTRMRVAAVSGAAEQSAAVSVTFNDVAGVDEAKGELAEVVEFLAAPERFRRIGARIPRGVLLSGPPGTGKTLLARAVAGEAGVPFFSISGSAFVEMYVGVGAARVRDLFAKARKAAPAIVFIDELDAVGGKRSSGARGGNDEREHTLNQLLVEMDGFAGDSGVVVIAATNRPDMLDAALLRPGRFDRRVTMGTPDRVGRAAVLALHTARVRMEEDVDLDRLAGQTSGMAPADLANVVNEAALLAARERREQVSARDLEAALLRVLAGPELKSRVMAPAIKRVIAYHEVGHALVMKLLPHCDPVAKVQAIARGQALGITVSMPAEDQYLMTRSALLERMVGIMGGRAAEELFFHEVTTGAQQDIQQANTIARRMVMEFGMSDLGHICVGEGDMVSPDLAARIDATVRGLVEAAYTRARALVTARQAALAAIADHLYEVETMDGHELDTWLARYPAAEELAPAA
jgi:cell division protease FtsH